MWTGQRLLIFRRKSVVFTSREKPLDCFIQKMEVTTFLRNVGNFCQSTRRHVQEDLNLQQNLCENVKSWIVFLIWTILTYLHIILPCLWKCVKFYIKCAVKMCSREAKCCDKNVIKRGNPTSKQNENTLWCGCFASSHIQTRIPAVLSIFVRGIPVYL